MKIGEESEGGDGGVEEKKKMGRGDGVLAWRRGKRGGAGGRWSAACGGGAPLPASAFSEKHRREQVRVSIALGLGCGGVVGWGCR